MALTSKQIIQKLSFVRDKCVLAAYEAAEKTKDGQAPKGLPKIMHALGGVQQEIEREMRIQSAKAENEATRKSGKLTIEWSEPEIPVDSAEAEC
jgi:hypothetical protein